MLVKVFHQKSVIILLVPKNIKKIRESGSNYTDEMEKQLKRVVSYLRLEDAINQKMVNNAILKFRVLDNERFAHLQSSCFTRNHSVETFVRVLSATV